MDEEIDPKALSAAIAVGVTVGLFQLLGAKRTRLIAQGRIGRLTVPAADVLRVTNLTPLPVSEAVPGPGTSIVTEPVPLPLSRISLSTRKAGLRGSGGRWG